MAAIALPGCRSATPGHRKFIGNVLNAVWEADGRDYCAARIDGLVAEGKLTEEQAARLKAAGLASLEALQREVAALDTAEHPPNQRPAPGRARSLTTYFANTTVGESVIYPLVKGQHYTLFLHTL